MKKQGGTFMKKVLTGVTAAMLASSIPLASLAEEESEVPGMIVEEADRSAFVYVPENIKKGDITTPILLVYGDEDYTAESALEEAVNGGFVEIAEKNNMVVTFVNSKGDAWSDEDVENYIGIVGSMYIERPASINTEGTDPDGLYAGYAHRIYVAAEGSGADFVTNYLVDDSVSEFVEAWNVTMPRIPTAVMLFNGTELPQEGLTQEYPAVIVNGSEELKSAYQTLNTTDSHFLTIETETADGFEKEAVLEGYQVLKGVRRTLLGNDNLAVLDVPDYAALGIEELVTTRTTSQGNEVGYILYIPDTADTTSVGTVPLVLTFHGMGENAEYFSALSTWPVTGAKNGFMTVSFDQHNTYSTAEIVEILEKLENEYPCIDKSRIYVSGFSMGGMKTDTLSQEYTELFAGIAPIDGTSDISEIPESELVLPMMYIAGEEDPYEGFVFPTEEGNLANATIERIFRMNGAGDYQYDASASNTFFGIDSPDAYTVEASAGTSVLTVSPFASEDGNVYTALVNVSHMGHTIFVDYPDLAWDFLSHFSRNEDGTITYQE
ncbi:MAG: prolyl oligopeptidase family serine peptidase [Eubacteriales bacterium]|nr:prolyl oligopeptidase family serine peptidase [Eubacteriales bacterium]